MSIEIKNVSKSYGATLALENFSVTFAPGRIYGLLGRNGAGKTTLLNAITGRIFADGGSVTVDGTIVLENDGALGKIYMMSEQMLYPEKMKVKDAFRWTKQFYPGFDEMYAMNLAERFKLNVNQTAKSLSTGYASIFKLITALATNAPYILLDEPVLGLDANHRDLFYRVLLEKYSEKPFTAVLSTHLVEEISGLVEQVVIVKDGKLLYDEQASELLKKGYTASGPAAAVDAYIAGKHVIGQDALGGLKSAYILGEPQDVPGIEITKMDLQKLFVQLTN